MLFKEKGDDMRDRYIAPAIMLVAGAVTSILNIINGVEFLKGLERLLVVLIAFYIIGKIAALVIRKAIGSNTKTTVPEENSIEENSMVEYSETEEETVTEDTAKDSNQ